MFKDLDKGSIVTIDDSVFVALGNGHLVAAEYYFCTKLGTTLGYGLKPWADKFRLRNITMDDNGRITFELRFNGRELESGFFKAASKMFDEMSMESFYTCDEYDQTYAVEVFYCTMNRPNTGEKC